MQIVWLKDTLSMYRESKIHPDLCLLLCNFANYYDSGEIRDVRQEETAIMA